MLSWTSIKLHSSHTRGLTVGRIIFLWVNNKVSPRATPRCLMLRSMFIDRRAARDIHLRVSCNRVCFPLAPLVTLIATD